MIQYILLGLLNYGPMTGYDLKSIIDHSTAHFWHAHHSQIYTTLRRMEQEGWVESRFVTEEGQPQKRVYTLTEAGRREFSQWLNQPMLEMAPIKEEFLVRIFFSGQRESEAVLAELETQRRLHQQKLADYRALESPHEGPEGKAIAAREQAYWNFTLDMGVQFELMYIEWLDATIEKVKRL